MRQLLRKYRKDQKGQTAIEFITVVVVIFFFLFFFLSLSILFVVSDYVEYSTFMAARTYKAMFGDRGQQERNANIVFNSYMGKINGIARNYKLEFLPGDDRGEQGAGVKSTYDIDLFYLPPIFVPEGIPPSVIRLTSESRLGRDSTNEECNKFFKDFAQKFGIDVEAFGLLDLMDDNAC